MKITSNIPTLFETRKRTARAFEKWCINQKQDISYDTARRILKGETEIRLHTAIMVSLFFGVPLSELFTIEADPEPK